MKSPLNILHLEDDSRDAALVQSTLQTDGITCATNCVQNRDGFVAALERGGVDLILSDFSLPAFDGLTAVQIVRSRWPDLPVILVSGTLGEELAVDSLKSGATDYVLKEHLSRLAPAVRRAMHEVEERAERRRLEAQFIEAQKMEVIGQLAGGVAHDFNNILAVIMSYSDLITQELDPDSPLRDYTGEIRHASQRAAGLTRQLLVFSRKQAVQPVVLDLNDVVKDLDKMLRRLIDAHIEMTVVPGKDIGRVRADPGYAGQVLMNLVVNARDAMPNGGKLTIGTRNVTLDENYLPCGVGVSASPGGTPLLTPQGKRTHKGGIPGDYVMLSVSDTGTGMTDEVKARIFEAFFTTKPKGKGTGLGLATCQTIVQQSGGHIGVYSELGRGTSFKVYFPRVELPLDVAARPIQPGPLPRGTETLMVVEDEPSVRHLARGVLENQGYEVLSASNGQDALHVAREHKGSPIRLVVTDVVMPLMGGKVMAEWLKTTNPDLKVLFTSGYADDAIAHHGVLDAGVEFLSKPYTPATLACKVREVLDNGIVPCQEAAKGPPVQAPLPPDEQERLKALHRYETLDTQLRQTVVELERAKEELNWKSAFLDAQANSSIDGILVVNKQGKKILQNQRVADLFKIPQAIADGNDDETQVRWVTSMTKNPERFVEKVVYLYSHPDEISRDEIELKDGTILDRYSSPVVGKDGKYYGRIWTFRDITERKQTENALRESNEKFHQLAANIPDAFWIRSPDMREVQYVSPAFERIWGRSVESLHANPQQWSDFILPEDRERVLGFFSALKGDAPSLDIEYRIVRPDGEIRWVRVRGFQVRDTTDKLIRHTGIVTDITERKQLEVQLFQSQKMETVGKLAGGVAHEFNSIMTVIIGQSELLLNDLSPGNPLREHATEIRKSADRAATLTRQLLAYGRKQILRPEILDLNSVLAGLESTLRHLMGRGVNVCIAPAAGLKVVMADAGQIEQVIMNMAMNAADAMTNAGKLTLETANVMLDQEYVSRFPELKTGEYVMLAITDTGTGMSEEVQARVFEPFFTTKDVGEGTGLGLSTCYGIVKQSGGHITICSESGRGATFKIYLPHVESPAKIPIQRLDSSDLPRGTETILLVEDDPALREMAATLLRRLGYSVLTAANGVEALKQQRNIGHIDLLFTAVVMPQMSGTELAERVRALYPHARILFSSAYSGNAAVHQALLDKDVAFLQKPFTPSALASKLREVLDPAGTPKPDAT